MASRDDSRSLRAGSSRDGFGSSSLRGGGSLRDAEDLLTADLRTLTTLKNATLLDAHESRRGRSRAGRRRARDSST